MNNPIDITTKFKDETLKMNIIFTDEIIPDGRLHRSHVEGDSSATKNGWYILHADAPANGVFGNWKTGCKYTWCEKSNDQMTDQERHTYIQKVKSSAEQYKVQIQREYCHSAELAQRIWDTAEPANPKHPYLIIKQISRFTARQVGDDLLLAITDVYGKLWSLQYIRENGAKKLLRGGAKKGNFIKVNGEVTAETILLCEGFATAASLATAYPSLCVISAIDAGNLKPVAVSLRGQLPSTTMIICADDDRNSDVNIGITKAREAAIASGAHFTKPQWPERAPRTLTDFNDLYCWLKSNAGATR